MEHLCIPGVNSEVVVLGPTNSDTLHEMLREVDESGEGETLSFKPRTYSPRATAEYSELLQGLSETSKRYKDIADYLAAKKLNDRIVFQRTTATDRDLAKALVKELDLRGVVPLVLLLLYWYSLNRTAVAGFLREAKNGIGEPLRRASGPWYRHAHWLLADKWLWGALLALLFIGLLGREFYRIGRDIFFTGVPGGGEPFFWFEGVSIWPSVMLRVLAGLLAIYFLLRGMHRLRRNDMGITRQFFADHERTILVHSRPILAKRLWHCLVRTRFCRVCLMGWLPRRLAGVQRRYDKAVFLWRDAVQPYTPVALIGRMLVTLLLLMVFLISLLSLFPFEHQIRPSVARTAIT